MDRGSSALAVAVAVVALMLMVGSVIMGEI
jgi:hypothetical protein